MHGQWGHVQEDEEDAPPAGVTFAHVQLTSNLRAGQLFHVPPALWRVCMQIMLRKNHTGRLRDGALWHFQRKERERISFVGVLHKGGLGGQCGVDHANSTTRHTNLS